MELDRAQDLCRRGILKLLHEGPPKDWIDLVLSDPASAELCRNPTGVGSAMIPAGCAFRSLLALKLWGIGRPSQVMEETLDEGLALFAGLNAIPKRATLSEYSCRVDPRLGPELMDRWHDAVRSLGVDLGERGSFDLDFHTIPYHGDDALIQKHYVSKRSRRQRGVLAFLVRDADARFFAYANANLRKKGQNDEILRFVEAWRARQPRAFVQ